MSTKISELSAATSIGRREYLPAVVSSTTKKVNAEQLLQSVSLWIDPLDAAYGAVGDGSTDDTTALQAAIDAAASTKRVVWLNPAKRFKITATLKIDTEQTTIWGGGVLPPRGRGATDTPSRTMKGATIYYTGTGDAVRVGKDQSSSAGAGTGTDFIYNVAIVGVRIEAPNAGSGRGCLVMRQPFECVLRDVQLIGPVGAGRKVLAMYGNVACQLENVECDGVGFPSAVSPAGSGYDNAAEWAAYFLQGPSGSTLTTTVCRNCYFHYAQKGVYTAGLVNFVDQTIIESCNIGLYLEWNSRQVIDGCYFENNTDADIYFGRNSSTTVVNSEFLIYSIGRTYAFDGENVADVTLRDCSLQNTQTSTPALFSTSMTLAGELFSGGDNSANSRIVLSGLRLNKPGWIIGGASSGATFPFDKCSVTDMQIVPYRFKVTTSGALSSAGTVTTVDGQAAYYMPMRGEVVGLQVELAASVSLGSYNATVTHNKTGSDVAVSGLSHSGVNSQRFGKKSPHWVSGAAFDAGNLLKATFSGNTFVADGTHIITVLVAFGQDGRGLLQY